MSKTHTLPRGTMPALTTKGTDTEFAARVDNSPPLRVAPKFMGMKSNTHRACQYYGVWRGPKR